LCEVACPEKASNDKKIGVQPKRKIIEGMKRERRTKKLHEEVRMGRGQDGREES